MPLIATTELMTFLTMPETSMTFTPELTESDETLASVEPFATVPSLKDAR